MFPKNVWKHRVDMPMDLNVYKRLSIYRVFANRIWKRWDERRDNDYEAVNRLLQNFNRFFFRGVGVRPIELFLTASHHTTRQNCKHNMPRMAFSKAQNKEYQLIDFHSVTLIEFGFFEGGPTQGATPKVLRHRHFSRCWAGIVMFCFRVIYFLAHRQMTKIIMFQFKNNEQALIFINKVTQKCYNFLSSVPCFLSRHLRIFFFCRLIVSDGRFFNFNLGKIALSKQSKSDGCAWSLTHVTDIFFCPYSRSERFWTRWWCRPKYS